MRHFRPADAKGQSGSSGPGKLGQTFPIRPVTRIFAPLVLSKVLFDDFTDPLLPNFHIHIRIPLDSVVSPLPVARVLPSGLKAMLSTVPECALSGSLAVCPTVRVQSVRVSPF